MPDEKGVLTSEDKEKIEKWLDERWKNRNCPLCDSNDWEFESSFGNILPLYIVTTGTFYSYVLIICNHCGYTHFLNAVTIGLVEGSDIDGPK